MKCLTTHSFVNHVYTFLMVFKDCDIQAMYMKKRRRQRLRRRRRRFFFISNRSYETSTHYLNRYKDTHSLLQEIGWIWKSDWIYQSSTHFRPLLVIQEGVSLIDIVDPMTFRPFAGNNFLISRIFPAEICTVIYSSTCGEIVFLGNNSASHAIRKKWMAPLWKTVAPLWSGGKT